MERMFLNQTALSLGYIALKRIRALEESTSRLPSSPLLRHLGHVKILTACVEQVGPEEIIDYEINQDIAVGELLDEAPELTYVNAEVKSDRWGLERNAGDDDVASPRFREFARQKTNTSEQLDIITEDDEETSFEPQVHDFERNRVTVTNLSRGDIDGDGEYSMDELYDEYNSQDDNWETASESSDDGQSHIENVSAPPRSQSQSVPRQTLREIDSDLEEEDDTPTPPSFIISHSPPLDITVKHPITHELSKREQYRRQVDSANSDLSRAFVEQIEDVLCHEIRCLSSHNIPGRMRLETAARQTVSLYA